MLVRGLSLGRNLLIAALCIFLTGCGRSDASTKPLRVRLGPAGEILGWLVKGPFPDPGAFQLHGQGFEAKTALEGGAHSSEEIATDSTPWKFAVADPKLGLNLVAALGQHDAVYAYCSADLDLKMASQALLLFGSDDGAKVFLDGRQVFSKPAARGIKRDEDRVQLSLRKGINHLLFKVEQLNQGWGVLARVVELRGKPLAGATEIVNVDPTRQDRWTTLRQTAGTAGAVDVDLYARYLDRESLMRRWLASLAGRAVKPEDLKARLDSTRAAVRRPGQTEESLEDALETGSASLESQFKLARSKLLAWAQDPGSLSLPSMPWIRVMPEGRYFTTGNASFMPIGYNHNPDWTELEPADPLAEKYDPARADHWFRRLADHGVDLIRLMVETPPSGNLEDPVGVFQPEHVIWLDTIFRAAAKYGIRLWVTPYDTFWMNLRSDASPYWSLNGGPLAKPTDFLTKPSVIDLQKRRMKFLIDRYGGSGVVFAWEVMNEIDLWWNATPEQIKSWTDQMVSYVRKYERQRWGKNHLVTISFGKPETSGLNAATQYRRKDLDFATMHLYLGASRGPSATQVEQAAADFYNGVLFARHEISDNRPVLDGESGPIDRWIADERLDDRVFHLMSWSHLLAGGAGSGTRWPYRNPHHLTEGMLETLSTMRRFCDHVDWTAFTGQAATGQITLGPWKGLSFSTSKGEIVWLRADRKQAKFSPPKGSTWRVFDVEKRAWLGAKLQSAEGELLFPSPSAEIACWITPL